MNSLTIGYVPYLDKEFRFLAHLSMFQPHQPTVIISHTAPQAYSDEWVKRSVWVGPEFPDFHKPELGLHTPSTYYAFWAFVASIRMAQSLKADSFVLFENDCRFTRRGWDTDFRMSRRPNEFFVGSPVVWHPFSPTNPVPVKELREYCEVHNGRTHRAVAIEGSTTFGQFAIYPNGALALYDTEATAALFKDVLEATPRTIEDYTAPVDKKGPFDLYLGRMIAREFRDKACQAVGSSVSTYSGCGNHKVSLEQRIAMYQRKDVEAIHHLKTSEFPNY